MSRSDHLVVSVSPKNKVTAKAGRPLQHWELYIRYKISFPDFVQTSLPCSISTICIEVAVLILFLFHDNLYQQLDTKTLLTFICYTRTVLHTSSGSYRWITVGCCWPTGSPIQGCICLMLGQNIDHSSDVMAWKHFPHYWPFVRGIHLLTKGQHHGFMKITLLLVWANCWTNSHDLKHQNAHVTSL